MIENLESRTMLSNVVLTGGVYGTPGSYGNLGNTISKAVDGNSSTYFDGPVPSGNSVAVNFGSPRTITAIRFAPRVGWESRMTGGYFQYDLKDPNFTTGAITFLAVTGKPVDGINVATLANPISAQYVRYVGPAGSYCDVAETEYVGTTPPTVPAPPTILAVNANVSQKLLSVNFSPTPQPSGEVIAGYYINVLYNNSLVSSTWINNLNTSVQITGQTFVSGRQYTVEMETVDQIVAGSSATTTSVFSSVFTIAH